MRRREVIAGLVGAVATGGPVASSAQQLAIPTIGILGSAVPQQWTDRLRAFREGLGEIW